MNLEISAEQLTEMCTSTETRTRGENFRMEYPDRIINLEIKNDMTTSNI